MTPPRRRLDEVLVRNGAAADLDGAHALIAQGRVLVAGAPAFNGARGVLPGEAVSILHSEPFVGRGGEKLDAALTRFDLAVDGLAAVDVGSSTGGFTDCLLQRGVRRVLAVDVGHGQLHERLADDDRVVSLERTNILDLDAPTVAALLAGPPEVATIDVSFTSLTRVVAHVLSVCAQDETTLVALVKPQFEATRVEASKGRGVVRDRSVWRSTLVRCTSAIERSGAGIIGVMASPLKGAAGNVEFLVGASRGRTSGVESIDAWIDDAIAAAQAAP